MAIWNADVLLFAIPLFAGCLLALGATFGLSGDGESDDIDEAGSGEGLAELGRPPFVFRLIVALLTFGAVGIAVRALLGPDSARFSRALLPASVGLASSWFVQRTLSRWVVRHIPLVETAVIRRREIVGSLGKAVLLVTRERGMAHVRDRHGDLHQISCHTLHSETRIQPGAPLLVVDYDAERDLFDVVPRPGVLEDGAREH
jgi:hypothetical protein